MKCPICGKDVELQKKQVGVDEQGAPVFHQYAVCRDCKKQWDLDKQRVRKAAPDSETNTQKEQAPPQKPESVVKESKGTPPEPVRKSAPVKKAPVRAESQENNPEPAPAPKPAGQKPAAGQPAQRRAPQENTLPQKEAVRRHASGNPDPASEKKVPQKAASGEVTGERKTVHKASDAKEASGEKPARRPASAETGSERSPRKPQGQKPSAEKSKAAKPGSAKRPANGAAAEKAPAQRQAQGKPQAKKRTADETERELLPEGAARKKPVRKSAPVSEEQRYGNIPPEKVRVKKEHAVRQGYEDMLSTDPDYKPVKKKRPLPDEGEQPAKGKRPLPDEGEQHAKRKRPISDEEEQPVKRKRPLPDEEEQPLKKERPAPSRHRPNTKADLEEEDEEEDEYEDEDDMEYEEARFRIPRILLGIVSILAAGFFAYGGFSAGLDNIASGSTVSTGTTYIIFAICMLVSGLLLLIMQNRSTILAYILPMLFDFGAAVFMFLKRQDDKIFLYCAIAGIVVGIILLVLGIISRNSDDYEDADDYDDPFEDDYE